MNNQLRFLSKKYWSTLVQKRLQQQFVQYHLKSRSFSTSHFLQSTATVTTTNPKLPSAYHCHEKWQARLETPILKKVELEDFFYQMDLKYQPDKIISPIDVDLYANKVTEEESLEELEELIYRLRKSPSTADTLPSTSHALVRALLDLDKTEMLFRILDDRMNYGIFLDNFTANLLMDKFLASGNYKDASKVAGLLMLQEDFGPPTTKFFAIYSCLKFLETEIPIGAWEPESQKEEQQEDEVKVRVKYLRNPFFDDHFELTEPQSIVGKTLVYASLQLPEDKVLANSIEIYGWALFDKWLKVEQRLTQLLQNKKTIYTEIITKVGALADVRLSQIEGSADKKLSKPKMRQVVGLNLDVGEVEAAFSKLNWDAQTVEPLPRVKALLTSKFVTCDLGLLAKVTEHLDAAISQRSDVEIQEMKKLYSEWEELRVVELNTQIERFKEIQLLLSHREQKKELKEREDTIFFFDNEEQWMMKLEEKEAAAAAEAKPEVVQVGKYSKPTSKSKNKKEDDSDYVSPII